MCVEQFQEVRPLVAAVLDGHPVVLAYLYGSHARGLATPLSDVDVAVVTDQTLAPRARLRLELTLETELTPSLSSNVDVRIINDAPLAVKGTVVQTGKLLYCRDEAYRVEFEATVLDRYLDFLPVIRLHQQAFLDAQRTALREKGLL